MAGELAEEAVRVAKSIDYRDHVTLDARSAELTLGVRKPDRDDLERAEAILARAQGKPAADARGSLRPRDEAPERTTPTRSQATVQALRIGDLGIVAIPCEVFVEIGLEIKAKSPLKPVFTIELANGYNGYLPTREQHALGGYETWRARSSYLEVDAAAKITAKVLELLGELK